MKHGLRIAFYTRAFGIRGTPGTYRMVEKLSKLCDVIILAPPSSQKNIVYESDAVQRVNLSKIVPDDFNIEVVSPLISFNPNIIYIVNFPGWYNVAALLRVSFPNVKIVLDIKTPLLVPYSSGRSEIQASGNALQNNIDLILTLSKDSVFTWIPSCNIEISVYPLGLDMNAFCELGVDSGESRAKNYVYIASLHPLRRTSELIFAFIEFYNATYGDVTLDIYGNGPDYDSIDKLILDSGASRFIRLKGLVEQNELLRILSEYDVGIAWVPNENYDKSPSLKLIEYLAAGLVVLASDTSAHRELEGRGFFINYFKNNQSSLIASLLSVYSKRVDIHARAKNRALVAIFDYLVIVQEYIIPALQKILGLRDSAPNDFGDGDTKLATISIKKLKLIILCNTLAMGKGGAEKVAVYLANEMSRRGHDVYMAYQGTGEPSYSLVENVKLLPFNKLSELGVSLSKLKPDVFHAFYFNRQLINYYYLTYNTGIPFTMQECTNPTRLITNNWGAGKISPVAARWEREIIASGAVRIRLVMPSYRTSFPPFIQKSIRAFSNPCYVNQNSIVEDLLSKRDEIIIVNGFKGNKNLITLLMAFNDLKDQFPSWCIKVVGNNEGEQPHKVAIREYINNNELVCKVNLVGATEDMETEYGSSKIHVIASLSEGCPTCVLEAMSCGLPSIGFEDCPGTNELIFHNSNGILANSADRIVGLRDSLYALMSNESFRQKLGQQALSDSAVFHPENVYDQWEELFYEASSYKNNLIKLYAEQVSIAPEATRHARRMRNYYRLESNKVL